jgi:hypothetical protein
MLSHMDMRALAVPAFAAQLGRPGTRPELQCFQAVGFLETGYAATWKPPGVGSWNFGAIQGTGPAGWFVYTDTHPKADGSSKPYTITFRKYPTAISGVNDLVRVVYLIQKRQPVLVAATNGDTLAFSTALHATGYYEGFGKTVAERIGHHHAAVLNACRLQALALGEPMPDGTAPAPLPLEALHQGMTGDRVKAWQHALAVAGFSCAADGSFGPKTRTLTMLFQKSAGLTMDGVVGPKTQAAAVAVDQHRATDRAPPPVEPNS